MSTLTVHIAGRSHRGMRRSVNEDSWIADDQLGLYAIADGMGGHGYGDVASKLAIETLSARFGALAAESSLESDEQIQHAIAQAIDHANETVHQLNTERQQMLGNGMGTTLVGLHCSAGNLMQGTVFNIGDSRLYLYRDAKLQQLTDDHSPLGDWQRNKRPGPAPPANIIDRAVGLFDRVTCDFTPIQFMPSDIVLLCSDGLSDMLGESELATTLSSAHPDKVDLLCDEFVNSANHSGGLDNITVLALAFE